MLDSAASNICFSLLSNISQGFELSGLVVYYDKCSVESLGRFIISDVFVPAV